MKIKRGEKRSRSRERSRSRNRSESRTTSDRVKQVVLSPVVAVKAIARGTAMVGRAIAAPYRLARRTKQKRRVKKMSKAERLAELRFSRMAPRLQADVRRTRRRLID